MLRKFHTLAAASAAALLIPAAAAQAHVSLHPNVLPAGSEPTVNIRVPNEETSASVTKVRVQLPKGVLEALGAPPAGWSFSAKTEKLAKPITTDDGPVTTAVTEIDFSGGKIAPGDFQNFPVTLSLPASAKAGDVLSFPTLQTYSNGEVVRWIGTPTDEQPAPTVDVSAAGGPLLDLTGGDAGPPAKLPASVSAVTGASATDANSSDGSASQPGVFLANDHAKAYAIIALVIAILALLLAGFALIRRRRSAPAD